MARGLKQLTGMSGRCVQAAARSVFQPLLPILPDAVTNRLPWLGRASASLPGGGRLRMICDGRGGKCYIARRVAGRSISDYEPETIRVFLALLTECDVFLDVGANTGIFALTAAALDSRRQVHAFEPVPHIAERLQANCRLNRLQNLTIRPWAVGRTDGVTTLHVPATKWSLPTSASTATGLFSETRAVEVPSVALDSYVSTERIGCVDLLKIDTETTEHEVIAGSRELLLRDEPAIIAEVLPDSAAAEQLPQLLERTPYRYFHIKPEGLVSTPTITADQSEDARNYLLITPRRLSQVEHLIVPASADERISIPATQRIREAG